MKYSIEEHYNNWVDETSEETIGAFTKNTDWKGHMVKGFIQYVLNEENK